MILDHRDISTDHIIETARELFDCNTDDGLPIESHLSDVDPEYIRAVIELTTRLIWTDDEHADYDEGKHRVANVLGLPWEDGQPENVLYRGTTITYVPETSSWTASFRGHTFTAPTVADVTGLIDRYSRWD